MGRLFWKFFLSILLAQLAAAFAVGGVFWLRESARADTLAIDRGPPAETVLEAAVATLQHGGPEALRALLGRLHQPLYVIGDDGRDVLGRAVPAVLRQQAFAMLQSGERCEGVRQLRHNERLYTFIVPRDREHPKGPPIPGLLAALGAQPDGSPPDGRPPGEAAPPGGQREPPPPMDLVRSAAPIAGATFASLLFAGLLAWYFSRPIRDLRSAFEAAAAGNLAPQFAGRGAKRGDELSDLGRDFDRMSGRLAALMEGQRRLLHDVSHELRAPLARLEAAVGLAHQQPEKVGASLQRIERESVRMDKLIGELLTLSRLEAVGPVAMAEQVDIDEIVAEIVADARYESRDGGLVIVLAGAAGAPVVGAADLLWRAIENIVRNAIKYGAQGGVVDVRLSADASTASIEVSDRGPGVAAEQLAHIFEPFFRASDGIRQGSGYGLGLAIAHRIVQVHGGRITARLRDGGGLTVTIDLPVDRRAAEHAGR
jgi:two-component system OmpR family sensor kinase